MIRIWWPRHTLAPTSRLAIVFAVATLVGSLAVTPAAEAAAPGSPTADTTAQTVRYTADPLDEPNPDRGLYVDVQNISTSDVAKTRSNGWTLIHSGLDLSSFVTQDNPGGQPLKIDQKWLNRLDDSLERVRTGGLKVILHFTYSPTVPKSDPESCNRAGPAPTDIPWDTTLDGVKAHLAQLKPLLARYADVISSLDMGFAGEYGEWHCSRQLLLKDAASIKALIAAVLDAFPADRQVNMRYPFDIVSNVANYTARSSRIGNYQSCYASSVPDDKGTWINPKTPSDPTIVQQKQQMGDLGVDHYVGGVACEPSGRTTCDIAVGTPPSTGEFALMHFSYLDGTFRSEALADYGPTNPANQAHYPQGCLSQIARSLGYRLVLKSATIPRSLVPGRPAPVKVTLSNDGWASIINQRPAFLVLDSGTTHITTPLHVDPRSWKSGRTVTFAESMAVPANAAPGTYRLSLWLPDQYTSLRARPEYSVRMLNQNTWDPATGLNVLSSNISLPAAAPPAPPAPPELPNTGAPTRPLLLAASVLLTSGLIMIVSGRRHPRRFLSAGRRVKRRR